MTMSEKLRRFAETHKMSSVARVAGVNPSVVNKFIHGKQLTVNHQAAFALARALSVSPAWLLDDSKAWPPVWENTETVRASDTAGSTAA